MYALFRRHYVVATARDFKILIILVIKRFYMEMPDYHHHADIY